LQVSAAINAKQYALKLSISSGICTHTLPCNDVTRDKIVTKILQFQSPFSKKFTQDLDSNNVKLTNASLLKQLLKVTRGDMDLIKNDKKNMPRGPHPLCWGGTWTTLNPAAALLLIVHFTYLLTYLLAPEPSSADTTTAVFTLLQVVRHSVKCRTTFQAHEASTHRCQ